ncbi:MAG TPA: hypothetical protein VN831_02370, partial [Bradyrhizobium sp.]|nr:hypothetical protein [Bradyrhizobium sp.]
LAVGIVLQQIFGEDPGFRAIAWLESHRPWDGGQWQRTAEASRLCRQLEKERRNLKIAMSQVRARVGMSIDRKQSWLIPLID